MIYQNYISSSDIRMKLFKVYVFVVKNILFIDTLFYIYFAQNGNNLR